jgi:hypothetical protein
MFEHCLTRSNVSVCNLSGLCFGFLPIGRQFSLKTLLCNPEEIFFFWKPDVNKFSICYNLLNFGFVLAIKFFWLLAHLRWRLGKFGFMADRGWLAGFLVFFFFG